MLSPEMKRFVIMSESALVDATLGHLGAVGPIAVMIERGDLVRSAETRECILPDGTRISEAELLREVVGG